MISKSVLIHLRGPFSVPLFHNLTKAGAERHLLKKYHAQSKSLLAAVKSKSYASVHQCRSIHTEFKKQIQSEIEQTLVPLSSISLVARSVFHYNIELSLMHQSYTEICLAISTVQFKHLQHAKYS